MRLRRLEPVLRQAFRGPCAGARGSRVLVAVSGGADSVALLVALASLARELRLQLVAAHLHHGLRGADADADLEVARAHAERLGVPFASARVDARAALRGAKLSGEAGLRVLRRRFLRAVAQRTGCAWIATAHTADDQLETVLMRLARGTGLRGLGGMRPRAGAWLKPMLGASRADVVHDLGRAALAWREDASNAGREHFRNRVRHDVVPALARAAAPQAKPAAAHAALVGAAARAAAEAAEGWRSVRARGARLLARATPAGAGTALDLGVLARCRDAAVRRAALRLWWARACPDSSGLSRAALATLLARLDQPARPATLALEAGRIARVRGGRLELGAPRSAPAGRRGASKPTRARVRRPGNVMLPARPSRPTTRSKSPLAARPRAATRS